MKKAYNENEILNLFRANGIVITKIEATENAVTFEADEGADNEGEIALKMRELVDAAGYTDRIYTAASGSNCGTAWLVMPL